jgi:hypothetical protein
MRYWLIYDLGLQGHYDELFAWLDQHKAKECGIMWQHLSPTRAVKE